ncbi:hypothetical protein [Longitalea luteola]|uniref:hypothetical protein n=1 Tax=Longitalea luteola TaxID=2812563 RepID=UPI001A96FA11|nr:hypothetical protein [Longitalea luteola]
MLGILDGLEEYNNAGALIGLDGLDDPELLGALRRMNPIKRQKFVNKLAAPGAPSKGSRAEMEKHFNELPDHIKEGIAKGELRLADFTLYSRKFINSKTIKMFETQDDKQVAISNISNAKLQKNQCLLVSGIYMMAGVAADGTKDKMMASSLNIIANYPAILSGEFSLKANKKQIVPDTSNNVFNTTGFTTVPQGYYKLANPRIIADDLLIEFTVELGTMDSLPPNLFLFAGLHGTVTTP